MADLPSPSALPWGTILPWVALAGVAYLAWRTVSGAGDILQDATRGAVQGIGEAAGDAASPLAVPILQLASGDAWRMARNAMSLADAQRAAFGTTLTASEIRRVNRIVSGETIDASLKVRQAAAYYLSQRTGR